MPLNKEAYLRYTIIDACITDRQAPFPSMEDLIEECGRKLGKTFSVSTIQKDIRDMKDDELLGFGAPIKFSKSRNGYYYSDPEFSIRKISLQKSDVEALKAATDILSNYSSGRVSENFNHAVDKIFASVHEHFPAVKRKQKIVQTDSLPSHKGFEHFEIFLHAANEKIPVCLVYYSYHLRVFRSLIVHPLILKEFQSSWYLIGYSENHGYLHTFGLDRIYDPKLLKRTFIEPKEISRENYLNNIYGVYPIKGQRKQVIEFSVSPILSDFLQAHPIHKSQKRKMEMDHGYAIFKLNIIPTQELINFLVSHGNQLVVTKPIWIRKEIRQQHEKAFRYEKNLQE